MNVKKLYRLQLSLANVSGFSMSYLSLFHQIFICKTIIIPQLNEFWDMLQAKLKDIKSYKPSIAAMYLRLQEL